MPKATDPIERFMALVKKDETTGCWVWQGKKRWRTKYGTFYNGEKQVSAHRWSYATFKGPIPEGKDICHTCDNPACVNPEHLWAGTERENMHDMMAKGRSVFGRGGMPRKLKETDIPKIFKLKAEGWTQRAIAKKFGVAQPIISGVLKGTRWSQVPRQLPLFEERVG